MESLDSSKIIPFVKWNIVFLWLLPRNTHHSPWSHSRRETRSFCILYSKVKQPCSSIISQYGMVSSQITLWCFELYKLGQWSWFWNDGKHCKRNRVGDKLLCNILFFVICYFSRYYYMPVDLNPSSKRHLTPAWEGADVFLLNLQVAKQAQRKWNLLEIV